MLVKAEAKAHFFDLKTPISIINCLETFKLACDTNNILEVRGIWFLSSYVKKIDNMLNSRIWAQNLLILANSVRYEQRASYKLMQSDPKVVICLLKKDATNQATFIYDAAIHR